MKLFQLAQRSFAVLGVSPIQSFQTNTFNEIILKIYFIYLSSCVFFFVYFFHVAKSFSEYVISIYMTSATVVVLINYTTLVCQSQYVFKFIKNIEKLVEKSKLISCTLLKLKGTQTSTKAIPKKCFSVSKYPETEANKIEKWSKIIHFIVAVATPIIWVMPKSIISLFVYITKDSTDSKIVDFELPLPMW